MISQHEHLPVDAPLHTTAHSASNPGTGCDSAVKPPAMALETGWSERPAGLAAITPAWSLATDGSTATNFTSFGLPSVTVPVLSRAPAHRPRREQRDPEFDHKDCRRVHGRVAIHEALRRCPRTLRLLDRVDDARVLFDAAAVTRNSSAAVPLIVPANTGSPAVLSAGCSHR